MQHSQAIGRNVEGISKIQHNSSDEQWKFFRDCNPEFLKES